MSQKIQNLAIVLSLIMLSIMLYQAAFKDSSKAWVKHSQPQIASYASLEEDEKIIKELERQTRYGSYKDLDPAFFVKPNIFNTIQTR